MLILLLLVAAPLHAAAPAFFTLTNSLLPGMTGADTVRAVVAGSDGAMYAAGSFSQGIATNGGTLTSAGNLDGFLMRINTQGGIDWAIRFGGGGTSADVAESLALDAAGNLYVGGFFSGAASFGGSNTNLLAQAGKDGFFASYTTNGTFRWVVQIRGAGDESVRAVGVGTNGTIKAAGYQTQTATWGSLTLNATATETMFVVSVDNAGQASNAQSIGADMSVQPNRLIVLGDGTTMVAGRFNGTASFPGTSRTSLAGDYDMFLATFNPGGSFARVFTGGGTNFDDALALTATSDGTVVVGASFSGTAQFDGHSYTTATVASWLGRFNTNGTVISTNILDNAQVTALAAGKRGVVHVAANFANSVNVGGVALNAANGTTATLVASYLAAWELGGVSKLVSDPNAVVFDATASVDDGVILGGQGGQSLTFDNTNGATTAGTAPNALICRLAPPEFRVDIAQQGGSVMLQYPAYYFTASLQTNAALPGTWGDAPSSASAQPGLRSVLQGITGQKLFFRLKRSD